MRGHVLGKSRDPDGITRSCDNYTRGYENSALLRSASTSVRLLLTIALTALFILGGFILPIEPTISAPAEEDYSRQVNVAPQPKDIGGGYATPPVQRFPARADWLYLLDVALLSVALFLAALIAHRWRRRWMAVSLSVACLVYFGFYRQGCVCPIGATQNVATGLADSAYNVPLAVLAFFLLPLVAALFVGRVFCSGPCPLGAIQDLVLLKPKQLPSAIDHWGGRFRYVYLVTAITLAAAPVTTRDYLICRFDPFVGFFRLTGPATMLGLGLLILVIGTVIGRPYCRFLCPYGALLGIVSRFAMKPVQITPDEEIDCGLCTESCPFGAIENMRAKLASCLACTRCFAHCPRQRYAWGEIELYEIEQLVQQQSTTTPFQQSCAAKESDS